MQHLGEQALNLSWVAQLSQPHWQRYGLTSPKFVNLQKLTPLLICHVVLGAVEVHTHPHQCLRQVGLLALRSKNRTSDLAPNQLWH